MGFMKSEKGKSKQPSGTSEVPEDQRKWIARTLEGYAEMFRGTGIIDVDEVKKRIREKYGEF